MDELRCPDPGCGRIVTRMGRVIQDVKNPIPEHGDRVPSELFTGRKFVHTCTFLTFQLTVIFWQAGVG